MNKADYVKEKLGISLARAKKLRKEYQTAAESPMLSKKQQDEAFKRYSEIVEIIGN
jgi:hypothetical protein